MYAQIAEYEETLISILHALPVKRVEQVVDFVRFIQWQEIALRDILHEDETEEELQADSERWDATSATFGTN